MFIYILNAQQQLHNLLYPGTAVHSSTAGLYAAVHLLLTLLPSGSLPCGDTLKDTKSNVVNANNQLFFLERESSKVKACKVSLVQSGFRSPEVSLLCLAENGAYSDFF